LSVGGGVSVAGGGVSDVEGGGGGGGVSVVEGGVCGFSSGFDTGVAGGGIIFFIISIISFTFILPIF
jgi:hypothetical protein